VPFLILSDIHGNGDALRAVLEDAKGRYDQILSLGDLVGYGAEPNEVVNWVRENTAACIRGNHDRACTGLDSIEHYNPAARASAVWTQAALEPRNLEYLQRLPRGPLPVQSARGSFDLVHGSPLDEDDYLVTAADVSHIRSLLETQLSFFGHTHLQGGFLITRGGVQRIAPGRILELEPDHYYLVNPGSVGQPRDGDPRAAYALYSPEARVVEFRRADYDVAKAAARIREAGLPESLALRLHRGT